MDFTFEKKPFSSKYIGKKANNDLAKYNLKGIKQAFSSTITKIKFNKYFWEITLKDKSTHQFKSLILTCPFPQLKKLAKNYLDKKILNGRYPWGPLSKPYFARVLPSLKITLSIDSFKEITGIFSLSLCPPIKLNFG